MNHHNTETLSHLTSLSTELIAKILRCSLFYHDLIVEQKSRMEISKSSIPELGMWLFCMVTKDAELFLKNDKHDDDDVSCFLPTVRPITETSHGYTSLPQGEKKEMLLNPKDSPLIHALMKIKRWIPRHHLIFPQEFNDLPAQTTKSNYQTVLAQLCIYHGEEKSKRIIVSQQRWIWEMAKTDNWQRVISINFLQSEAPLNKTGTAEALCVTLLLQQVHNKTQSKTQSRTEEDLRMCRSLSNRFLDQMFTVVASP